MGRGLRIPALRGLQKPPVGLPPVVLRPCTTGLCPWAAPRAPRIRGASAELLLLTRSLVPCGAGRGAVPCGAGGGCRAVPPVPAEDLALQLAQAIEDGDEEAAAQCAVALARQQATLSILLKDSNYPPDDIR